MNAQIIIYAVYYNYILLIKIKIINVFFLNEITIIDISNVVRNRLEEEGLTVIHKRESAFGQPISYDIIKW